MDEITPNQNSSTPLATSNEIVWEAFEYDFTEKHPDWYWIMGTIAGLAILLSIVLKNFLLAIILLLGSISIYFYSKRPPLLATFAVTPKGIKAFDGFYRYDFVKSFWIHAEHEQKILSIESDRIFLPFVKIPLGDTDPEAVRHYLLKYLREKEHDESLSEKIFEFFGF